MTRASAGIFEYDVVRRSRDNILDRAVVLKAQPALPIAKEKERFLLPPKRLLQKVGEPPPGSELFRDSSVIGFCVLIDIRLPADNFNGNVNVADMLRIANIAAEHHSLLNSPKKAVITVEDLDALKQL